jgi:glycosyltransferase involved in cell wall biosynthesis
MLEPWALRRSRWKKEMARLLFENSNFRQARLWRALTSEEADQIRQVQPAARICVVPNGLWTGQFAENAPSATPLAQHPELAKKKWLLFLSRVHAKKGVDVLIKAWAEISSRFPEWHLVVAGPDDGYLSNAVALAAELGVSDSVCFPGLLRGATKRAVLQRSGAFVLPSYSEGFSMAVLEALASGLPCVITPNCHFPEVETCGGGLVVEPQQASLAKALFDLLQQPEKSRANMAECARSLARRFDWIEIGTQFATELSNL